MFGAALRRTALPAARAAARPSLAAALPRLAPLARGYADAAPVSDQLTLKFLLPHEAVVDGQQVAQVNASTATGDIGILSNHVPTYEQLKPGVVEIIQKEGSPGQKYFVSSGFLAVHPNNTLDITAVEAFPLESFSLEATKSALAEAQKVAAGSGSEVSKIEAEIEVEVLEALENALKA